MAFVNILYGLATLATKGVAGEDQKKANVLAYGVPHPADFNTKKPARPLDAQELRALAVGAILFYHDNQPTKGLYPLTRLGMGRTRANMREWWGITNTEEAIDMLTWLRDEGHRVSYSRQLRQDPARWQKEFKGKKLITYTDDLDIGAWDYCRLVNVARSCYDCGYLSWEQAWGFIAQGNELALRSYTSWESFANGFTAGRFMWNQEIPFHNYVAESTEALLTNPDSLWKQYLW